MKDKDSPLEKLRALQPSARKNGVSPELCVEAIKALRRGCKREEVSALMGLANTSHNNIYAHLGSWAIKHAKLD